jgi:hypothetical protein
VETTRFSRPSRKKSGDKLMDGGSCSNQPNCPRPASVNFGCKRSDNRGVPKVAAIFSVVESCRRLKLSLRDYLAAVLAGLADLPIQRLAHLTPAAWVAQYS